MKNDLEKLNELVREMKTAILVTRRPDGHMVARPMALQAPAPGADYWFVTSEGSGKLDDLTHDPHVNVTFFRGGNTREWVSIAGIAKVTQDRGLMHELYRKDWRLWFPDRGDPRDGTADDPRMVLIGVDVHSALFLESDKPAPAMIFEMIKSYVKHEEPDLGEIHHVSGSEMGHGPESERG